MQRFYQIFISSILLVFLCKGVSANVSIPFELINGLIIVEAEINKEKGNYILDSGANGILINNKNLSSGISFQTLSGTVEGSETKINTLKLGDFESEKLVGFSTDLSSLEAYINKSLAGILSCAVFEMKSIEFDFVKSIIVVSDNEISKERKLGRSSMDFHLIDEVPICGLTIGQEIKFFILDSGASSHFLDSSMISSLGSNAAKTGVSKNILTASGESRISDEYTISNHLLKDFDIQFKGYAKDFSMLSLELGHPIHGLLSLSKLASDIIVFDIANHKIYF